MLKSHRSALVGNCDGSTPIGVKTMMTENPCYKAAHAAAEEAIDALLTLYWADSFDADLLQTRLAEIILLFTQLRAHET